MAEPDKSDAKSSSQENKSKDRFLSTSVGPFFIILLSLANYFYHWNVGFRIDAITLLIDVFTFFMFYFAFNSWSLASVPFFLQTILPGLLIIAPGLALLITGIISLQLIVPWFFIF